MDARLTNRDFDILLEALEAWEKDADNGIIIKGIIGSMIVGNNPESRRKYEMEMKKDETERNEKLGERKKIAIILKAKLFMLQQTSMDKPSGLTIDEITE